MKPHLYKTLFVTGESMWVCSMNGTKTSYFLTPWGAFRKWQIFNGVE